MSVNIGGNVGNLQVATNINTTTTQNFIDSTPQDAVSSSSPQPSSVTGTPPQTRNWPGTINETAEPQNQAGKGIIIQKRPKEATGHDVSEEAVRAGLDASREEHLIETWLQQLEPPGFLHDMVKGYVLIINNELFPRPERCRDGSCQDVEKLRHFFRNVVHWNEDDIQIEMNKTANEMRNIAKRASGKDFSSYSAFFFVVLSHGSQHGVLGVDEETVDVQDMVRFFAANKCRSLAGKPKVFIMQACRGDLSDDGVTLIQTDAICEERSPMINIPALSDFLILYPCIPGYTALRNETYGTYFIQALVHVFTLYHDKEHLIDLLLRVNYIVANTECTPEQKSMPCQDMQLRKKCYFHTYFLKLRRKLQERNIIM